MFVKYQFSASNEQSNSFTESCGNCEWEWDEEHATYSVILSKQNSEVMFHNGFSCGTAAVRGNKLLEKDRHHYWEVEMLTPIYGTDVVSVRV